MTGNPVRGAVMCSGSASSFRWLCENDPNCGIQYEFVGVLSDVPDAKGVAYAQDRHIPTAVLDFKEWCTQRDVRRTDLAARERYFEEVVRKMKPWNAEFVMLSGFMLIVTDPLLAAYDGRVLNVHPALLSILDDAGKRKYMGLKVVERAMKVGDPTGSTVHIVTREPDTGPIVAESEPLPYQPGDDPDEHQERMKSACDGPAFRAALAKLIKGGWPPIPWFLIL